MKAKSLNRNLDHYRCQKGVRSANSKEPSSLLGSMIGKDINSNNSLVLRPISNAKMLAEKQAINSSNAWRYGPHRRRRKEGCVPENRMKDRVPVCGIKEKCGDARFFVSDNGLWRLSQFRLVRKILLPRNEFWLILPEVTAIEVRLSHASRM